MFVLAADPVTVAMGTVNMIVSLVLTIVLFRVAAAQRRYDRLEDNRDRQVADLKTELQVTTEKLVDARLRSMSHELMGSVNGLLQNVELLKLRLAESEHGLAGMGERDHTREIQILQGLAQIKQHLAEQAASKGDLKEHQREMSGRVDQLQRHLGDQDTRLARIEAQVQDKRGGGRGA